MSVCSGWQMKGRQGKVACCIASVHAPMWKLLLPLAPFYSISSRSRVEYSNRWIGKAYSNDRTMSAVILFGRTVPDVSFISVLYRALHYNTAGFLHPWSFCSSPSHQKESWNGYHQTRAIRNDKWCLWCSRIHCQQNANWKWNQQTSQPFDGF